MSYSSFLRVDLCRPRARTSLDMLDPFPACQDRTPLRERKSVLLPTTRGNQDLSVITLLWRGHRKPSVIGASPARSRQVPEHYVLTAGSPRAVIALTVCEQAPAIQSKPGDKGKIHPDCARRDMRCETCTLLSQNMILPDRAEYGGRHISRCIGRTIDDGARIA